MSWHDYAPFLWLGFFVGFLASWLAQDGLDALERWLIKRVKS